MIHVRQHEMGWKKIWIGVNQKELVIRCFLRGFENCRFVKCLIKVMVATTMLIYSRCVTVRRGHEDGFRSILEGSEIT